MICESVQEGGGSKGARGVEGRRNEREGERKRERQEEEERERER